MARTRVEPALLPTTLSRPASDVARERWYTVQCAFLAPILGQSQSLQDQARRVKTKGITSNTTFKKSPSAPCGGSRARRTGLSSATVNTGANEECRRTFLALSHTQPSVGRKGKNSGKKKQKPDQNLV
ncbi:hypothetical protein B0H14DRAFT_2649348 [Mycena olivaceomarginata]|nr:hypothetical protein B0H14DRAFT_2649348 [Mycena olivaceomarginata]